MSKFPTKLFLIAVLCSIPLAVAYAKSVEGMQKKIEKLDRKQYEVMGFYPGMSRVEAFKIASALPGGMMKGMEESQGIYYVRRQPDHLIISVNFPAYDEANAKDVQARKIKIETKLPGDEIVVADDVKADMIKKFGEANIVEMGNRVGFSPVDMEKSDSMIAQECAQIAQANGENLSSRETRDASSTLRDESFAFLKKHCPSLIDAYINTQLRKNGPLMNVHYTPGQKYITYYMDYEAAYRFSKEGEERCAQNPQTC